MIKLRVQGDLVMEGTVFAADPVTHSLILKTKDDSYKLIHPSNIIEIEGNLDLSKLPNISELGVTFSSIDKYENRAYEQSERALNALNFDVTPEIQMLFDRLNFIFPCHWNGSTMVVLNEFTIDPPYDTVTAISSTAAVVDTSGMERVIKVLEGERKKLKLTMSAAQS